MTADLANSIGRRGFISTTGLMLLTLYSAKETLQGVAGVADIISRVAACGKNIATLALTMPGWKDFGTQSKAYLWEIYQPTKTGFDKKVVADPEQPTLTALAQKTAFHLLKGVAAYDFRLLVAGAPPSAYGNMLSKISPFTLNPKWQGPVARLLIGQFPEKVAAVQKMNFYI
jgi:hypothetical protein